MRAWMIPVCFGLALLSVSGAAFAQADGRKAPNATPLPAAKPPVFPTLFPNPTNNNGYEEWVQAADLIRDNANVEALDIQPYPTLTLRRRALADPAVVQALILLRAGLNKPVFSPRTTMDENTALPEIASFRHLARLLYAEIYVQFADGRVDAAIGSLRVGLAFGHHVQTDNLISGLVGVAINSIVLKGFSAHLDQLSVYHCEDVRRIVEDFLRVESPAARLLTLEKGYTLQLLEARRSDADGLMALIKAGAGDASNGEDANVTAVKDYLTAHPSEVNALIDDAQNRVNALFEQTLLNLRLPLAQRKPLARDNTDFPGASLFRVFTTDPQRIMNAYTTDQARLRMLGVHALIHRYRWEHNALPDALAQLHAANLVKDAFTGSEIVYKRDGDRYTLTSQGPL